MNGLTKAELYEMERLRGITISSVWVDGHPKTDQIETTSNITVEANYSFPVKSGKEKRRERRKSERRIKKTV